MIFEIREPPPVFSRAMYFESPPMNNVPMNYTKLHLVTRVHRPILLAILFFQVSCESDRLPVSQEVVRKSCIIQSYETDDKGTTMLFVRFYNENGMLTKRVVSRDIPAGTPLFNFPYQVKSDEYPLIDLHEVVAEDRDRAYRKAGINNLPASVIQYGTNIWVSGSSISYCDSSTIMVIFSPITIFNYDYLPDTVLWAKTYIKVLDFRENGVKEFTIEGTVSQAWTSQDGRFILFETVLDNPNLDESNMSRKPYILFDLIEDKKSVIRIDDFDYLLGEHMVFHEGTFQFSIGWVEQRMRVVIDPEEKVLYKKLFHNTRIKKGEMLFKPIPKEQIKRLPKEGYWVNEF